MDEATTLIQRIASMNNTYDGFINFVKEGIDRHPEFIHPLNDFLDKNPKATPEDILEYIVIDLLKHATDGISRRPLAVLCRLIPLW